jgi:protease II
MADTLHAKISKSEYYWWRDNNYTEKSVTKILSQITYDIPNIW